MPTTEGRATGALTARLDAAQDAARAAGAVLMAHAAQRSALVIDCKGVNDFVSQADRDAEDAVFAILSARFPQDRLLGEERGYAGPGGNGLTWCIDPLDGTSNFLKAATLPGGANNWCVSIGLLDGNVPVLGVILDPVRGEMFEGGQGLGARCNGQPIATNAEADPGRCLVGIGHTRRIPVAQFVQDAARLVETGLGFRQVGAGALMLAYLAAGRIDAYFERHMWPWDAVAGLALIRAAGGDFAPYLAGPVEAGGPVLAANADLLAVLRSTLDL